MEDEKKKPFGFEASYELYNVRGERLRNVLLRENPGSGQTLQVDIVNILSGETITLNTKPEASESDDCFHFHLHFTAGAIADRVAGVAGEDWDILRVASERGTDLFLAWRSPSVTLAPGDRLVMLLHGVSAGLESGAEVTMHLAWPEPTTGPSSTAALTITPQAPGEGEYEQEENLVLDVRDRRGRPDIPLRAVFVGPNQVLNVDNEESTLTLRLVNSAPSRSQETLRFLYVANQPALTSSLVLALPVGTAAAQPWALGTKEQVNGVVLALTGWRVSAPTLNADEDRLEWTLTPTANVTLAPQQFLDISLSKLVTAHPSGTANLELRHSAVPGYWDGEIVCPIEKAPLVFGRGADHQDKVGIGESQPNARLTVQTATEQHGFLHTSNAANGAVKVGTYVDQSKGGYVGTSSDHPLHFFTNNSAPKLTLTTDGHLHVPGPLVFRTDADSTGEDGGVRFFKKDETTLMLELNKDGTLELKSGRIKDKTGFLVPVGTIVAYGGSAAPAGWLLCDGAEHASSSYPELSTVLGNTYGSAAEGKFKVPNLTARVPVGAGTGYSRGATGGAATVTLTVEQMPAHTHGVNDPGHTHEIRAHSQNQSPNTQRHDAIYNGWSWDMNPANATTGISIQSKGGGQAHENMPPYLVINYIIKH
jgi:microcystin-dependent protein